MDSETKQGLLPVPTEEEMEPDFSDWRHEKAMLRKKYIRRFIIVQVVLILVYGTVLGLLPRYIIINRANNGNRSGEEFVYTPAAPVDKFELSLRNNHLYHPTPWKGPPSPEVDEAWDKLFANSYIRLAPEEIKQLGRNSTPIPDGSGDSMGALDMYHQLHCVRFIFKYIHRDYYAEKHINVPPKDHINHCIDILRDVVMCLSDTSISTTLFYPTYERAWPEFKFQHSCRNFEAVDAWAGAPGRHIDQQSGMLEDWLRNPNFITSTVHQFDGHGEPDK